MTENVRSTLSTYPALYQVNTRLWLTDLSRELGRSATLDDIPNHRLDRLSDFGFDWIWFLGVWQTGPAGARVSRANSQWRREFSETLSDLNENDIAGSCFAITAYHVSPCVGGDAALVRLRERMKQRGLRLMLDFVPNHTARDHPWTVQHADYYVLGDERKRIEQPHNYDRLDGSESSAVVAYGRDPNFPGWPDTAQLNYANPELQRAMSTELMRIADRCDGVRCDMAMLILPEIFERTWGMRSDPFWPKAIREVKRRHPDFVLMAEVYWDLEWTLQQQGFDFTYDKRLYDRLRDTDVAGVRAHLRAEIDFQRRLARFLENHDEPRAATVFPPRKHQAAAVVTFLTPGLRFIYDGQLEGCRHRISPHLVRAPVEPVDITTRDFYTRLLRVLGRHVVRTGTWKLLDCVPAWEGNDTWSNFIVFEWCDDRQRLMVAVNFASHRSQCFVQLPGVDPRIAMYRLTDLLGSERYDREGSDLSVRGFYLDVEPWQYHVLELAPRMGAAVAESSSQRDGAFAL